MGKGTLGSRLGAYLDRIGMSQAELGRRAGVKQQTISYLISSDATSSAYAVRIASALGVNPAWLQDGVGHPLDPTVSIGAGGAGVSRAHWVPKVTMDRIAQLLETGAADGPRVVTSADVGEHAFAVEVEGRSMQPDFREGDELVVDPSTAPEPGDIVVALVDQVMVLRKYRPKPVQAAKDSAFTLTAINPDYPEVDSSVQECRLVGTVVEHRRRLRR